MGMLKRMSVEIIRGNMTTYAAASPMIKPVGVPEPVGQSGPTQVEARGRRALIEVVPLPFRFKEALVSTPGSRGG